MHQTPHLAELVHRNTNARVSNSLRFAAESGTPRVEGRLGRLHEV